MRKNNTENVSITDMLVSRINNCIDLIASNAIICNSIKNTVNNAVYINNIYSEGYVGRRFYTGCQIIDTFESRLIQLVQNIFKYKYVNVQAPAGSIANQIIYTSILRHGDYILSMRLVDGGHLTHSDINHTSTYFKFIHYSISSEGIIDYDTMRQQALKYKPKIIIAGYSCYPFDIDHKRVRAICDEISAVYLFDMCHISDLIAGGVMSHAHKYADIAMTTTHKGIRGAKGAIIMSNNKDMMDAINKYAFPKTCGGQNTTSLICNMLAFEDMAKPQHAKMAQAIVHNSKLLIKYLTQYNVQLLYNDSQNHIIVIDLHHYLVQHNNISIAQTVVNELEKIHIYCNINATYKDTSFFNATGIRLGTKIITYRNISEKYIQELSLLIANVIQSVAKNTHETKREQHMAQAKQIISSLSNLV